MPSERHILFRAAAATLGLSMAEAARRVGCTPYHLLLVLEGARQPSTKLDAEITQVLREAKPQLLATLASI